jgi:serine/threonine protein kinase
MSTYGRHRNGGYHDAARARQLCYGGRHTETELFPSGADLIDAMDEQDEALRARAEARLGSTLQGKYRLDRVLGIGGMATVFAATHRNQAELAVKVLHPELSLREDLRKRFLREGYVGNSVKHPGAVLVVDDDIAEDGSAFLVMELLRGRSLEEVWERTGRRMSSRAVTALTLQLLEVLAAAHEKSIVHRDLKPANLFLSLDGSIKVLDFGIARLRDAVGGSEHATRTGTLMGTPAFMAPEQAQAIAADIDGQTDLWAVGATMYTLLSGELVHDGDNSSQLLIRAGTTRARPLLSVAPDVERSIAAVVDRALTFEKSGRWPTAEAMRDALLTASVTAHGTPPGRDVLIGALDPEARRSDLPHAERLSTGGGTGSGAHTPRLVVKGEVDIHANDPTFATPAGSVPPPVRPLEPPPRTSVSPSGGGPLPGVSTANPVSAEFGTGRTQPPSSSRSRVVVAIALLVAAAALIFAFTRPKVATRVSFVGASPPTASASPPPVPSAPPPAPVAEAPAALVAAPPPPPVPTPAVVEASPPRSPKHVTSSAHPTAKPAAAPAVDCSTPYTLDADGNKKWKLECVQH